MSLISVTDAVNRGEIMSAVLTPFMRQLIRLIEHTDVHVHPHDSTLRSLKIDSPDLRSAMPDGASLYGLPLRVGQDLIPPRIKGLTTSHMRHSGVVVARFDARAPVGMPLRQAKRRLITITEGLKDADALLIARGYRRVIRPLRPADFTPHGKKFEQQASYRVVRFDYIKGNLMAREAVEEAQWFLPQARHFWPGEPWKR